MDIDTEILGIALRNALFHGGRADVGAVIAKIMGAHPEMRKDVKNVTTLVRRIVNEVNTLGVDAQTEEAAKLGVSLEREEKQEREGLPDLPNAREDGVITRFAPNPSAPLHLGHSRALLLSGLYVKKYGGRFIVRFDDTDPRTKVPMREAYNWILEDVKWFGLKPDLVVYASDRMDVYYGIASELIKKGGAYVCDCNVEAWRSLTLAKKACPCRSLDARANESRWAAMLDGGYKEGGAVVRVKTDIAHANPAIRDWPAFRIIETPHTRVGTRYRVWPLYNFASAIDDHELGVTHVFRGQEHLANQEKQSYLFNHLKWKEPTIINYGRLFVEGIDLSKSKIIAKMKSGELGDWDDPRLGTLRALRRRGFQPQALVRIIEHVAIKPSNATISMENLSAENKRLVDFTANRYYFVGKPVAFALTGKPPKAAQLQLHPDDEARGVRNLAIGKTILLDENDVKENDGKEVRLKGLFNVNIDAAKKTLEFTNDKVMQEMPKIHWLPADQSVACKIVMPDASELNGVAENNVLDETVNNVVQFERFGFVRIDAKEPLVAYFAHR
ncbi:MAG: glutamate--tRNA ligase [Candidatus Aenigmarchaeota archaeon]|nr:glutamate--tRNA ligase [Candidatus Aenigmarchaeota archaeon]